VLAGRLQREVVAVALPGGRHDHHPGDAGRFHLVQQVVFRERLRPVGSAVPARRPGPLRRVGAPDMDLRIDDQHPHSLEAPHVK